MITAWVGWPCFCNICCHVFFYYCSFLCAGPRAGSGVVRIDPLRVLHLLRGAGHEKRRGEQLKWSLAFRLCLGNFPCAQLPGPVHTAQLGRVFFGVFRLGLYFVYSFVLLWFVCMSPSFYVSLGSWVVTLTVFGASVTNLNEPPKALATCTIAWVTS